MPMIVNQVVVNAGLDLRRKAMKPMPVNVRIQMSSARHPGWLKNGRETLET
jgi:hypothetical protein